MSASSPSLSPSRSNHDGPQEELIVVLTDVSVDRRQTFLGEDGTDVLELPRQRRSAPPTEAREQRRDVLCFTIWALRDLVPIHLEVLVDRGFHLPSRPVLSFALT